MKKPFVTKIWVRQNRERWLFDVVGLRSGKQIVLVAGITHSNLARDRANGLARHYGLEVPYPIYVQQELL